MFKKTSIPATSVFVTMMLIMYALKVINGEGFYKLFVLKQNFMDFYPWQIITYIFYDDTSLIYYFFKLIMVFWFCSVLESEWGSFHFSIFLLTGILFKSISAIFINYFIPGIPFDSLLNGYDTLLNPNSLMLCLMTAFGFIYPDHKIYLFFIIPVRIKYLSIFSLAVVLIHTIMIFISGGSLFMNTIYAYIYLSGFIGILIYSRRIFGFKLFNFTHYKAGQIAPNINRKIMKENEKILQSSQHISIATPDPDAPLCDDVDFDTEDTYCKNCDRFGRCLSRRNTTKTSD